MSLLRGEPFDLRSLRALPPHFRPLRGVGASVDPPSLFPSLPGRLGRSVVIRFELAAPVVVPDNGPVGCASVRIQVTVLRCMAATITQDAAFRIVKPAIDADGDDFFFLIH